MSALAVEETMLRGSATVTGVPGDQAEARPKVIRSAFRANGSHCGTRVFDESVVVWLEDGLPSERQAELEREAIEALEGMEAEGPMWRPQDRAIRWSTWG